MKKSQKLSTLVVGPLLESSFSISPDNKFKNFLLWLYASDLIAYNYQIFHNTDLLAEGHCKPYGTIPCIVTYKNSRDYMENQQIIIYIKNLSQNKSTIFNLLSCFSR